MGLSFKKVAYLGYILILGLALCGCGGGGVGDLASSGGGKGGTGISVGSVSAIGSIYVNGVRYNTGNAEIFVEGQSKGVGNQAVLDQLSVGMVVRVEGEIEDSQNGTAFKVYFNDDIRGPVEFLREIDHTTVELSVLGKAVIIQDITNTEDLDLNSLALDDWVQISGSNDADGRIIASFVTSSDSAAKANLKGVITQLDTISRQFMINTLVIDYQEADLIGMNPLSENLLVEVTGVPLSADHIKAGKIEVVDLLGATDAESIELEGVILEKISDTQFKLDGVNVMVDLQTGYIGGEPSEVDSGVRVEVEGELVGGILHARKIIFLDYAKVESDVDTDNLGQSEISLVGLEDITIRYNEITKVTGAANGTDDITGAHHVKIIGRKTLQDALLAIHIIVKSDLDSKIKLQGQLESNPGPIITILGHPVDLSSIPDENFELPEGVSVGYTAFLNLISMGDLVSASGELTGNQVLWQRITAE